VCYNVLTVVNGVHENEHARLDLLRSEEENLPVNIELINTGSELLLGRVLNTHQQWLCRRLSDLGHEVQRQVTVPDTAGEIQSAVREALSRADLVIVTGGLGPTSDDITRELIAKLLGKPLHLDEAVWDHIKRFFAARRRPVPANNELQAMVPEGATVLANPSGTAPGLALPVTPNPFRVGGPTSWLVMLPGPPRELRPMFQDWVKPLIQREFPLPGPFVCRTLRSSGVGESAVQERIAVPLAGLVAAGLEVGYCARVGQVDVRLIAHGPAAEAVVRGAEAVVQKLLGANIYGYDDDDMETMVVHLLAAQGKTLGLAESCTGGGIANRLTNVPGASAVFAGGYVTYSNTSKQSSLGVRAETLAAHGAVSEEVAREMAEGARARLGVDFALAVTGIAGPTGGSLEKPVGTVYIALAGGVGTEVQHKLNTYEREAFKQATGHQAMEMLRRRLVG
jgi:nicotinamide-nucleotide amidase